MVESSSQEASTELPSFDAVWSRLRKLAGFKRQADLAEALKITGSSVSGAKQRGFFPLEWAYKLALTHQISLDFILKGVGEPEAATGIVGFPMQITQPCDPELVLVPKVKARLSAGTGSLETNAEIMGRFAFRSSWIRSKGNPESMVLMDVTGDSMSPTIEEGDATLIDQSQTDIYIGKIYAIGIDSEVFVKYVDRVPGKFILRSANKDYAPIPVDLTDESCNVRIIGRVVWWCREAR
ncbi:helix-turn-helix transcriptional regulator [Desulfocurvibacter africanus]|uniref:LexA family transcriptional regulator n=1 Tax=Desulfocurvibacter africanus TaxID=873 RepID=UPI002FDA2596